MRGIVRTFPSLQGHTGRAVVQSAAVYLHAVTSAASACELRAARVLTPLQPPIRTPSYPFHLLCLDVLSFVPAVDHYVPDHRYIGNPYVRCHKGHIPLSSAPCEMSDVLANDKCRRRYRVSDLTVRTPN